MHESESVALPGSCVGPSWTFVNCSTVTSTSKSCRKIELNSSDVDWPLMSLETGKCCWWKRISARLCIHSECCCKILGVSSSGTVGKIWKFECGRVWLVCGWIWSWLGVGWDGHVCVSWLYVKLPAIIVQWLPLRSDLSRDRCFKGRIQREKAI